MYHILQLQLMRSMYKCLDSGGVGIFESPTGTGKSLSIICAALTWLQRSDVKRRQRIENELTEFDRYLCCFHFEFELHNLLYRLIVECDADSNWVAAQTRRTTLVHQRDTCQKQLSALDDAEKKVKEMRQSKSGSGMEEWVILECYYPVHCSTRKRKDATTTETNNDNNDDGVSIQGTVKDVDDDIAPPIDYDSDGEDNAKDEQKEKVVELVVYYHLLFIVCLFVAENASTCYESVLLFTYA
jgi:hypothetical protein